MRQLVQIHIFHCSSPNFNEKNLNYRKVAWRSRGLISHGTVYDIISGRNLNPSLSSLRGLAKGLGITEEEMFAAATGKTLAKSWPLAH